MVDRYIFKEDEIGYLERLRTHLYVFDIGSKTLTQVTSGDFDDVHPAWSPDGKFLAFSSKRTGPDPDRNYDSNIFVVAADNPDKGAHLTQITTNPGSDDSPAWSPDGKWIAYVTQLDPKLLVYATQSHRGLSLDRRRGQSPHPESGPHVHRAAFLARQQIHLFHRR